MDSFFGQKLVSQHHVCSPSKNDMVWIDEDDVLPGEYNHRIFPHNHVEEISILDTQQDLET